MTKPSDQLSHKGSDRFRAEVDRLLPTRGTILSEEDREFIVGALLSGRSVGEVVAELSKRAGVE